MRGGLALLVAEVQGGPGVAEVHLRDVIGVVRAEVDGAGDVERALDGRRVGAVALDGEAGLVGEADAVLVSVAAHPDDPALGGQAQPLVVHVLGGFEADGSGEAEGGGGSGEGVAVRVQHGGGIE
ncbi:hypothetical protein GCM10020254_70110 [Streptomyces goshikiensis]